MAEYLTLFIGAVVVNNFVLTKFLGLCIFFGISKNFSASVGMGMAVTSVMTMSSILAWLVYHFVLEPLGLTFLTTIVFVILTASFVQLLELVIKKQAPALYNMWGIYLLLIATNCIVLAVPLLNVENSYSLLKSIVFAIGSGLRARHHPHGESAREARLRRRAEAARGHRHRVPARGHALARVPRFLGHDVRRPL